MKKIWIVTVYNSLNAGSFFQATYLYSTLEKMGYEVGFYKTGARSIVKQLLTDSLSLCKHLDFNGLVAKIKTAKMYNETLKRYDISDQVNLDEDIFVLGSDEIWNVNRECMSNFPVFWGKGLNFSHSISYAPSINKAKKEELESFDYVQESLNNLHAISVRDTYSQETLMTLTDRSIQVVCDPTVLVYPEAYEKIQNKCKYDNYILIYAYYKAFTEEEISAIKAFAKENNKKIISFGMTQHWCDYNVYGSPNDFLMYIKYADYVCTCTFHGTMLSLIFQKQFAVIGKKKPQKVFELLNKLELDRVTEASGLNEMLLRKYDYEKCDSDLKNWRDESIQFLKDSIETIE